MQSYFTQQLLYWHKHHNDRHPIGEGDTDPYRVWIREIILQQTRVEQATAYYHNLLKHFPTVHHLACADEAKVFKVWEGLGYYSRCRNMMATAKHIAQACAGVFPNTYEGWLQLKGVGEYTAAAMMSFCYRQPYAVVDGNVLRVLARYFGIYTDILSLRGRREIKKMAQQLISPKKPEEFNQAIMDFGATVCIPKNPKCSKCMLQKYCFAFEHGEAGSLPVKKKKAPLEWVYIVFFVIQYKQTIAIYQQSQNDIWKGLYLFPHIALPNMLSHSDIKQLVKTKYPSLHIVNITETYQQTLTHKRIRAQFVVADSSQKITESEWIHTKALNQYFFPRIIRDFLQHHRMA